MDAWQYTQPQTTVFPGTHFTCTTSYKCSPIMTCLYSLTLALLRVTLREGVAAICSSGASRDMDLRLDLGARVAVLDAVWARGVFAAPSVSDTGATASVAIVTLARVVLGVRAFAAVGDLGVSPCTYKFSG